MEMIGGRSIIAWGCSKLLELYMTRNKNHSVTHIIDINPSLQGACFQGVKVSGPDRLNDIFSQETAVVVFAVSNLTIQAILSRLHDKGLQMHRDVYLYADLFYKNFSCKLEALLGRPPKTQNYSLVTAVSLATHFPIHTTLLGNLLFLEILCELTTESSKPSAVIEVGAYAGGNSLLGLIHLTQHTPLPFYILDSFEGFPDVSSYDPRNKHAGDYALEIPFARILNLFSSFPNARVIKGPVPDSFAQLNEGCHYGLVLYDCDLYMPAVHTFEYFWEKIIPGGFLLIHDYYTESGGFEGVRRAADEFFVPREIPVHDFWESTMGVAVKANKGPNKD